MCPTVIPAGEEVSSSVVRRGATVTVLLTSLPLLVLNHPTFFFFFASLHLCVCMCTCHHICATSWMNCQKLEPDADFPTKKINLRNANFLVYVLL